MSRSPCLRPKRPPGQKLPVKAGMGVAALALTGGFGPLALDKQPVPSPDIISPIGKSMDELRDHRSAGMRDR